jgi:hypothetical protein
LTQPAPTETPDDAELADQAAWRILLEDPLFELRLLQSVTPPRRPLVSNQLPPGRVSIGLLRHLELPAAFTEALDATKLKAFWPAAYRSIAEDAQVERMLVAANRDPPEISRALARALVAALVQQAMDGGHPGISSGRRTLLVALLVPELGKQPLGPFDWVTRSLLGIATTRARRRRRALTHGASFVAGDIILYQSRGQPIRDYIRDAIIGLDREVVVLGHSLGGIAAFEALIQNDLADRVTALVTIGSQVPFLYEIDALTSLRFGNKLPPHFPRRWLNIWDPNDFLSFVTDGVLTREIGDDTESATYKIEDCKIESGVPFPASHSAYWDQDAVWTKMGSFLE